VTVYLLLESGRHGETDPSSSSTAMRSEIQSPSTMTRSGFSSKSVRASSTGGAASGGGGGIGAAGGGSSPQSDGWHSINVYYGERSGLGAPEEQESFAQVHQDEIVLDLIGPNGYFIDLAANDAKDLTNTLALERHGWDGLCVEPNPG
jgi:hypothetical protein